MKNNTLIRNIAVLLVVALVCVMTGQIYLKQLKNDTFYTANPNITKVLHLSDYNPNLKGTANDVEVYVFDSGVPVVMCGLDVTLKAVMTPADWDALAATGRPCGKFVRDCLQKRALV